DEDVELQFWLGVPDADRVLACLEVLERHGQPHVLTKDVRVDALEMAVEAYEHGVTAQPFALDALPHEALAGLVYFELDVVALVRQAGGSHYRVRLYQCSTA